MTDNRFTAEDLEHISELLADKVASRMPPHSCPFSGEIVTELEAIGKRSILIRAAVTNRLTDFFVYGTLALIVLGVIHWIRERMP